MSTEPRTFKVEYALYPPLIEDQPTASGSKLPPTSAQASYPITPSAAQRSETSTYYAALSLTLKTAQKALNEDLTLWKDALGDREKSKEDPGTVGYGRGKAAVMSEDVRGEIRQNGVTAGEGEGDSDSSDEA